MQKEKNKDGVLYFIVDVPLTRQPVIVKEYYTGKVRMYKCANGKAYYADQYDAKFKPQHNLKVMPKNHKGSYEKPLKIN